MIILYKDKVNCHLILHVQSLTCLLSSKAVKSENFAKNEWKNEKKGINAKQIHIIDINAHNNAQTKHIQTITSIIVNNGAAIQKRNNKNINKFNKKFCILLNV